MKILALFLDGFEETELITVLDLLRRAECTVDLVSADEKKSHIGTHGIIVGADYTLGEVDINSYDGLFLPGGGGGVERLAADNNVLHSIREFEKQNKWLTAICAAPYVLEKAGVLAGKKSTIYPGWSSKLKEAEFINQRVVVDEKLITAQGMGVSIDFGLVLIEQFKDNETALQIKESIIY